MSVQNIPKYCIQFLKIISLIKVKTMKIGERFAKIKFGFLMLLNRGE